MIQISTFIAFCLLFIVSAVKPICDVYCPPLICEGIPTEKECIDSGRNYIPRFGCNCCSSCL
ncbi:hypothetical protein C0J52_10243 [Blattella germanica]|nr:hypothetical protein C0J52_10243 [Blattella germanica]